METKQFKVGQVWRARGGWVYPPITEVDGKWVRISRPGPAFDINDGKVYTDPSMFDLVELVQDAPEPKPKPKTRRHFTESDMPSWDKSIVVRLKADPKIKRLVVLIYQTCVGLGGSEYARWDELAEKYEYTIDGGKTWLPFYVEE
jgi:hypothetical protein